VSASANFTIATNSANEVWGCGRNNNGQLGLGNTTGQFSLVKINNTVGPASGAFTGGNFTLIQDLAGNIWSAGSNAFGQLGRGLTTPTVTTFGMISETGWSGFSNNEISVGWSHVLALKQNGELWAWGDNTVGQLGNGTQTNSNVPIQIGTATDWEFVAASRSNGGTGTGAACSAGIRGPTFDLYMWGRLPGTTTNTLTPTYISSGWASIQLGEGYAIGSKLDGTYWAWGRNDAGQLGLGDYLPRTAPTQIQTLNPSSSNIYFHPHVGWAHSIIRNTAGFPFIWGNNNNHQAGGIGASNVFVAVPMTDTSVSRSIYLERDIAQSATAPSAPTATAAMSDTWSSVMSPLNPSADEDPLFV
jgi:alpha-tubulin suppressor-like RCC1 family protein